MSEQEILSTSLGVVTPTSQQDSLRLRAVEPEDTDFMLEVENDEDAWIYGDTVAPLSREQIASYAMTYTANPALDGQLRLILERHLPSRNGEKEALGILDLYDISERHGHGFIGIYLKRKARGIGLGGEGVKMLARLARKYLNLNTLCAKVAAGNEASRRFFLKCGFRECGMMPGWLKISGQRHDMHLLCLELENPSYKNG